MIPSLRVHLYVDYWNFVDQWEEYCAEEAVLNDDLWIRLLPLVLDSVIGQQEAKFAIKALRGQSVKPGNGVKASKTNSTPKVFFDRKAIGKMYIAAFRPSERALDRLSKENDIPYQKLADFQKKNAKQIAWVEKFAADRPEWYKPEVETLKISEMIPFCFRCGTDLITCPNCHLHMVGKREKGVDMALGVDLVDLASRARMDQENLHVVVLASGDGDFVPAIRYLRGHGVEAFNLAWRHSKEAVSRECDEVIWLDDLVGQIVGAEQSVSSTSQLAK